MINIKGLFKVKGANRYETVENMSFLMMGVGILLLIVGYSLSVSSAVTVAGYAAIFGSLVFFVFLVILILALFVKEIKTDNNKSE